MITTISSLLARPKHYLAVLAFTAIAAVLFFWGGLGNLGFRWSHQPEYSHGFLIPLVSLYILWESKSDWMSSVGKGHWIGVIICAVALLFSLAGEISALFLVIHYAFILFLFGLGVCVLGRDVKLILVPIGLLIFAIPLPYIIEVLLTAKLQLISSSIGVSIIRAFDIPVHLSGNVIDMGALQLHVVEACSGLRYLFPLASMGVLVAYFYRAEIWKKVVIVISTIPITIVLNSIRIGITGVMVESHGVSHAQGFLHDFEGWVMFVLCLAMLSFEVFLIERLSSKRSLLVAFSPKKETGKSSNNFELKITHTFPVVGLFFISTFAAVILYSLQDTKEKPPEGISFASFPMNVGQWQGVRQRIQREITNELNYTDALMADYIHKTDVSKGVNFYMAYYETQRKGVSPHSPKVCIPGGGWEISEFDRITLEGMPVNRAVIRKGQQAQLVYYWFVERGNVVANEYTKKWMLFIDGLKHKRTDGALIRVVAPVSNNADIEHAENRVRTFVQAVHPRIMSYLPGRIESEH